MTPPRTPCRIKVCGITDASEAAALDALGVDWLGFNFHPRSPRFISPEDAAPIIKSLKRSVPVGVSSAALPLATTRSSKSGAPKLCTARANAMSRE